ncbi:MAG TPA: hypothetical protein VN962_09560 [Polyangia bacterium]|nr:hypothetical protein [Polyangia bacterium]
MATNPFEALDAIYAQLRPAHATGKKPAPLEPDAPSRMREMWEATGVSDATGIFRSRADSEAELARIFAEWVAAPINRKAWGADAAAFRRALPARLRLLRVATSGIAVSDETGDQDDPPVLLMKPDESPLVRYHDRYTEWQIWRGLGLAASIREAKHQPLASIERRQILTDVYSPGLYELAERIWWLHMPPFPQDAEMPVNPRPVLYASAREYLEFLLGLTVEQQAYFSLPKSAVFEVTEPGPINLAQGEGAPDGFRVSKRADDRGPDTGWFQAIGRVGQALVWLVMREKSDLTVGFDPAARDRVRAWLEGLGVAIARERPLKTPASGITGW